MTKDVNLDELNYGITNFDNIGSALLTLFHGLIIEGWIKSGTEVG